MPKTAHLPTLHTQEDIDRFLEKIEPEPNSGCWLWCGALTEDGYGWFWFAGRARKAHRIAWTFFVGKIEDGLEIDHLCDTRACVNPAHGQPVTHAFNLEKMIARKRAIRSVALSVDWREFEYGE